MQSRLGLLLGSQLLTSPKLPMPMRLPTLMSATSISHSLASVDALLPFALVSAAPLPLGMAAVSHRVAAAGGTCERTRRSATASGGQEQVAREDHAGMCLLLPEVLPRTGSLQTSDLQQKHVLLRARTSQAACCT